MKYKLVEIKWVDAETENGWMNKRELDDTNIGDVYSFGLMVYEDEGQIKVIGDICDGKQLNRLICIPKAWIKRKKVLKTYEL